MFLLSLLIVFALLLMGIKNPIVAINLLVVAYALAAVLFIIHGAESLAVVIVIVYAGAISVLFPFMLMLMNSRGLDIFGVRIGGLQALASVIVILLIDTGTSICFVYSYVVSDTYGIGVRALDGDSDTGLIGQLSLNYHCSYIAIAGVISLLAMIGSIVIITTNLIKFRRRLGK